MIEINSFVNAGPGRNSDNEQKRWAKLEETALQFGPLHIQMGPVDYSWWRLNSRENAEYVMEAERYTGIQTT